MQNRCINFGFSLFVVLVIATVTFSEVAQGARFGSSYPCSDGHKTCHDTKDRIVTGVYIKEDCWEYSYTKTCSYPSKDDCKNFAHCYAVADLPCLLRDSLGNCVNLQKEFCCKSWEPVTIDKEMVRIGFTEKEGKEKLVCKGVPCIDGNCVDKSYLTDDDMMDSISKLYAVSQMKGAPDLNFKLFAGFSQSCSKKAASYTNCCTTGKGWGTYLGARCSRDEQDLMDKRKKNLCEYACKENKQMMGITVIVKHHYCCFGSLLNKVIQVQARKQLFPSKPVNKLFENNGKPDCRGLTLAEIMQLDFDKMDFSEFFQDILKRMKIPKAGDISARVSSSLPNIRKGDDNPRNKENNKSGWSTKVVDDSFEAEEEKRLREERRKEEERMKELARQAEEKRLAEERRLAEVRRIELAKQEEARRLEEQRKRELLARAEEEKRLQERNRRRTLKEQEVRTAWATWDNLNRATYDKYLHDAATGFYWRGNKLPRDRTSDDERYFRRWYGDMYEQLETARITRDRVQQELNSGNY